MAVFNFDEEIDRREVPALKPHRIVLGTDGMDLFPAGVADMDFRVAPPILEAMRKRLHHGVFGYEAVPTGLFPALTDWFETRHGWPINPGHILRAPNVLNSLAIAASLFTEEGDGIIVQPPVFFDFYDIISENGRQMISNPLILKDRRYEMDFEGLEQIAAVIVTAAPANTKPRRDIIRRRSFSLPRLIAPPLKFATIAGSKTS